LTLVIDASVALKWVFQEEGTEPARALLGEDALAAPDLLWIECANVLWAKARRGQIEAVDARAALAAIEATPIRALPTAPITAMALEIALDLDHAAYDCLYLAAALDQNAVLVTADEAFASKAMSRARYAGKVRCLMR
jgi:predicted nucleic acid-binding protein